ncbi:RNA polymerase sigma-70 factor, ECF subfamily [Neorhodopirellula lusitana]|uniref:RNA polymerase sigma-70 factor, ECF subfamily n=1 Tax=Neorhodopirellula lusitana TaxID=445327 RepID=A0ABY1PRJ7_9BACT|nr:sigma-70 family RNA polymerase sigma factor [Neorhodopirellula lusitana]SMP42313.1 RNA polymerase sigma-70 factor, ECF subfamily [Neorhodopirellula lusitana]
MDETTRQATRQWTLAQPAVSAFVTSMVRDFRDRDDVLQDVAVAVIESFDSYDPKLPFVPWAIGVARNQVGLYMRNRRKDRLVFDEEAIACLAIAIPAVAPQEAAKLNFVTECLSGLESRAHRLFELRYQKDMKPAAIAERVDMSANSVAKALQRIRDRLRVCVERKSLEATS